jgi:hypothetical protein
MYLGYEELLAALPPLKKINPFFGTCFLAFKRDQVPVGSTRPLVFSSLNRAVLDEFYRPLAGASKYYHPFHTSNNGTGWVSLEYARTSLQRIVHDTFRDIAVQDAGGWGWSTDHLSKLKEHLTEPIPAFCFGVWLLRDRRWTTSTTPADIISTLFHDFRIDRPTQRELFDTSLPQRPSSWLSKRPLADTEVIQLIGPPPGTHADRAASLLTLQLDHIGPATRFQYEPARRLNILTGDNSLGKTFVLECVWWALTGEWIGRPAMPRPESKKNAARITYEVSSDAGRSQRRESTYDWDTHTWSSPKRDDHPGLAVYARFDGAFAVWDPARRSNDRDPRSKSRQQVVLNRDEIWEGKVNAESYRQEWVCNGLIRDWVTWQTAGDRYKDRWEALTACMKRLSPSEEELLTPGEPMRLPGESRDIPSLKLPYGIVPVYHASAGVQRIIAIAYVLVWAWHEHVALSSLARREPQRRLTLIIDEIEAHLHPRWQRVIVPAVVDAASTLSEDAASQVHLATHSPMVLASAESLFDVGKDALHHLRMLNDDVVLEHLPFVKRGRVDLWLMSPAFGLGQARSLEAERAIADAIELQREDTPSPDAVKHVDARLSACLASDDSFWPRWRHFALSHGVEDEANPSRR